MKKYVLTLVTFCVALWAWLIHRQRQFPQYEWYKPFRRRMRALIDEYCKVSKNLQSVETLISKTENDLNLITNTSSRREVFQNNLKMLREKQNELENKYMDLSAKITELYSEHFNEIESAKNTLNPKMLELRDLWRVYKENRI